MNEKYEPKRRGKVIACCHSVFDFSNGDECVTNVFKDGVCIDDTEFVDAESYDALAERCRELEAAIQKLKRGCDCEYDYRCSRCQAIIDAKALAAPDERT